MVKQAAGMPFIPGPITLLECIYFVLLVVSQLVRDVGAGVVLVVVLDTIPFLLWEIPYHMYKTFRVKNGWHDFVVDDFSRTAHPFEVIAARSMKYAFEKLPLPVLRCFFHKDVALDFANYRYRGTPDWKGRWHYDEEDGLCGIWIKKDATKQPDFVLYYIHGGGYVYGSVWFYLTFLLALHSCLCTHFDNPAIFALSYSPAPEKSYPTQVDEARRGFAHVVKTVGDAAKMCIAGDSAGGGLAMMVIHGLGNPTLRSKFPKQVLLISPWLSLDTTCHPGGAKVRNNIAADAPGSDFITPTALQTCARSYAPRRLDDWNDGEKVEKDGATGIDDEASVLHQLAHGWPRCRDSTRHQRPVYQVWYGANETLAPEIGGAVDRLEELGWRCMVSRTEAPDKAIHVWPVTAFWLARTDDRRLGPLRRMARHVHFYAHSGAGQWPDDYGGDDDGVCAGVGGPFDDASELKGKEKMTTPMKHRSEERHSILSDEVTVTCNEDETLTSTDEPSDYLEFAPAAAA